MPTAGPNPLMILVLGLAAALLCIGVLQLIADLRKREDKRVRQRLAGGTGGSGAARTAADTPAHLLRDFDSLQKSIIARFLNSDERGQTLRRFLLQADVPWPAHQVVRGIGILVLAVALVGVLMNRQGVAAFSPAVVVLLALTAGALPVALLVFRRARRLKKFTEQLPEVFELLGQALRAGHALITGIHLVGEQLPDPAGREFMRVFQEQNFGVKLEDALSNMAERVGILDARMFVTAVIIQRQTGGDLAEVLDKSGEVIRDRLKVAGAVKALTAEGRMSGWVLTVLPIFVGMLAWRINPDYMSELFFGDAKPLLKFAIFLHITGFILIQKCIQVKY